MILGGETMYRIGQSSDIHQLVKGRKLILGGVEIPHDLGLLGHSDADVLTHAIAEALIGALALGDLGTHFPDTDPKFKDSNSLELLAQVVELVESKGYQIVNIDSLVLIEKPKLAKYIKTMKENLCTILKIDSDQLNLKATRGESLGYIGRQEGVMAQAVVLVKKVTV